MDYFSLSVEGKLKLARWISKRYRKLCISELVRNSKDEEQLFAMCEYIDRWDDEHPTHQEPSGATQIVPKTLTPDVAHKVEPEAPVKPQKEITKKTKGRINAFIINHPGAPISEIVNSATDEAELIRTIEEMSSKVVPVDTRIKLWTCTSRRL